MRETWISTRQSRFRAIATASSGTAKTPTSPRPAAATELAPGHHQALGVKKQFKRERRAQSQTKRPHPAPRRLLGVPQQVFCCQQTRDPDPNAQQIVQSRAVHDRQPTARRRPRPHRKSLPLHKSRQSARTAKTTIGRAVDRAFRSTSLARSATPTTANCQGSFSRRRAATRRTPDPRSRRLSERMRPVSRYRDR